MPLMRRVVLGIAVGIGIIPAAWAGPSRDIFRLIEGGRYTDAGMQIRRNLNSATGEERNIYLFLMGFVLVKDGRMDEARQTVAMIDPSSEWAEDARFLLRMYGQTQTGAGPDIFIRIASGQSLTVGRERFQFAKDRIRRNGKPVSSPCILPTRVPFEGRTYRGRLQVEIENGRIALVNILPMEEYLYGVIKNEIDPAWNMEAVKAQAIAARTFAYRRMNLARGTGGRMPRLAADVSIQVYRGIAADDPRSIEAVDATRGQVLTHAGEMIEAVFHSESGGMLESSRDLWGRDYSYLVSKPDPYAGTSPRGTWEAVFDEQALLRALDKDSRRMVGRIREVEVSEKSRSGRAKTLTIHGTRGRISVPAGKYRLALGPDRLRSLLWTHVEYSGHRLYVKGRGWGHGVGMSQWGAKAAADRGLTTEQILRFYFPGTEITTIY